MAFSAGQLLVKSTVIDGDNLDNISRIKGEVAGKLGRLLVDEYKADKVVLNFKDAEKLKSNKKVVGKTGLTYTIVVDDKAKAIELCLQSAKKEIARVEILGGLDSLDTGATVVNLQDGDKTIDPASKKQAVKFNGIGSEALTRKSDLSGINTKKKIVLCGHGGGKADVKGDKMYTAKEFGGSSASDIIKFLIKEGLSPDYSGTIYLSGCHTAAGYGDPKSFASKVHSGFASKGYKSLSVAGTPGEAWTTESGDKGAIPSNVSEDLSRTIRKVEGTIGKLEKAMQAGVKDQKEAETQLKLLVSQIKENSDLILLMPVENQAIMTVKMLNPIQANREKVENALQEMVQSNESLIKAYNSENAYLTKLKRLMASKKKLEEGAITQQDYNRKEEELFTVENWWGVFGPAKATVLQAKEGAKKSESLFQQFKNKFGKKEKGAK